MIRRSIIAVAAVIMFSAAAASTQAFASIDTPTPDCALITGVFTASPVVALSSTSPHD